MTFLVRLLLAGLTSVLLAGCAYKPLKAPCSADEGETPLSYAEPQTPQMPAAFTALDRCGPMRPI